MFSHLELQKKWHRDAPKKKGHSKINYVHLNKSICRNTHDTSPFGNENILQFDLKKEPEAFVRRVSNWGMGDGTHTHAHIHAHTDSDG